MFSRTLRAAGLLLACALGIAIALPAAAAPRRDAKAQGNDCAACHGSDKVMPAKHKATLKMKLADCVECHERKTDDTLIGKLPGSHLHQLAGVVCADCHGAGKPEAVEQDKCIACHGNGEKMLARTAKLKPQNPHESRHYGTDLDCNVCHRQHEKSEDYCAECHKFGFKVP